MDKNERRIDVIDASDLKFEHETGEPEKREIKNDDLYSLSETAQKLLDKIGDLRWWTW